MKIECLNIWGAQVYEPFMDHVKRQAREIDIFCFQEVFHNAQVDTSRVMKDAVMDIYSQLATILSDHQGYFAPSQSNEEGIAMFVRNTIQLTDKNDVFVYRWKDAMINNDTRTLGRNLQYVVVDHNGVLLTIANFHGLWNGQGKTDTTDRKTQSQNIQSFLHERKGPVILCGDFNLLPGTESMHILEDGMQNLITEYGVTSTRSDYYTKPEKYADYILVSPEIVVTDFRVLPDQVSDHLPLVLEIL